MIPLQTAGQGPRPPLPSFGGGPEDFVAFLYWLVQRSRKQPSRGRAVLLRKKKRLLKMLQTLDAARTLQLARQLGQFS